MSNGRYAHYHDNSVHGDDRFLIRRLSYNSVLDVVADGVSKRNGSTASALTIGNFANGTIKDIGDIVRLVTESNRELFNSTSGCAKTTITASLNIGNRIYLVNVGDSPGYLIRGDTMEELTVRDNDLSNPNAVTHAIGECKKFLYHATERLIEPGDKLFLATDGITKNIARGEILDILYKSPTPKQAVRALEELLERRRKQGLFEEDDITAIIRYFSANRIR